MALKSILLSLLAPAAALVAVPAMAQAPAPASDASLPTCSAKVTDHCMQRSGGGHMAGHAKGHKMAAHHGKRHAGGKRHHKAMKHHASAKTASVKPAPAAPAKPRKG